MFKPQQWLMLHLVNFYQLLYSMQMKNIFAAAFILPPTIKSAVPGADAKGKLSIPLGSCATFLQRIGDQKEKAWRVNSVLEEKWNGFTQLGCWT